MTQTNPTQEVPYFFLVTERYAIGTPRGISSSDKTIDIPFNEFAENIDLQERLKLLSSVLARPEALYAAPLAGRELRESVATYLAAFCNDPKEQQQRRNYLMNNGLVRILVTDDNLRKGLLPQR